MKDTRIQIRKKVRNWINRAKTLHGDPHYIAMGMAIGFFVAITPTIPFQTIIAVGLAFILKGSSRSRNVDQQSIDDADILLC